MNTLLHTNSPIDLDELATWIDRYGFDATPPSAIGDVVQLAQRSCASPVLTGVLADPNEPAPVRERAFGLIARQVRRSSRDPRLAA
jgi:hypothetical protein